MGSLTFTISQDPNNGDCEILVNETDGMMQKDTKSLEYAHRVLLTALDFADSETYLLKSRLGALLLAVLPVLSNYLMISTMLEALLP